MYKALPAVIETSESRGSLSPIKNHSDQSIVNKTSVGTSTKSSVLNVILTKKQLDSRVALMKSKIKQLELKNIKFIRAAENSRKKNQEISSVRRESQNFKSEFEEIRKKDLAEFENKKKRIKDEKKLQKENLFKTKEKLQEKVKKNKSDILKERKENEEYIKKRNNYYKNQAKEKILNLNIEAKSSSHRRARSALNTVNSKESEYQFNLISEIKFQKSLLKRLNILINQEQEISISLHK